jgi:hypothetical protein
MSATKEQVLAKIGEVLDECEKASTERIEEAFAAKHFQAALDKMLAEANEVLDALQETKASP